MITARGAFLLTIIVWVGVFLLGGALTWGIYRKIVEISNSPAPPQPRMRLVESQTVQSRCWYVWEDTETGQHYFVSGDGGIIALQD